jgi:hypothetical protein
VLRLEYLNPNGIEHPERLLVPTEGGMYLDTKGDIWRRVDD